jgi:tRNA-dihydrouridine synthase
MEYRDYWEDLDLPSSGFSVEEFLREEQQNEEERLEQELERLESLLEERREIHSETVEELESKLDWYVERLEDLYHGFGGVEEGKKERLKSKIDGFYSELRSEKRQQWRDRIELEMEVREVEQALEELRDEDDLWKLLE